MVKKTLRGPKNRFQVSITNDLRPKAERLKQGSGRKSLSNVIEYLLRAADEKRPEWNAPINGDTRTADPVSAQQ